MAMSGKLAHLIIRNCGVVKSKSCMHDYRPSSVLPRFEVLRGQAGDFWKYPGAKTLLMNCAFIQTAKRLVSGLPILTCMGATAREWRAKITAAH